MSLRGSLRGGLNRKLNNTTIRARLLVGFVLMALLPAIGISAGSAMVGYYDGQQQASDRLESVAARKESEIAAWTQALHSEMMVVLSEPYALDWAQLVLDLAQNHRYYDTTSDALRNRFQAFLQQIWQFEELILLDKHGRVVVSTDPAHESRSYADQPFFQEGLSAPDEQPRFCYSSPDSIFVISSAPFNKKGRFSGMMVGRANTGALIRILDERTGLGDSGKSYLVDQDHTLWIGDGGTIPPLTTGNVHTSGLDAAVKTRSGGSGIYDDYNGVRVLGAYRWLPELQMALLIEQDLSEAFRAVYTSLSVNLGIALVTVLLAASASLLITRSISVPLINLAETASLIAAGDLQQVASVERGDEIGALATAFNSMTAQLRDLIANLEERVRERTNALRQRALELETSALVSREVTSILDMDQLLPQVVELIRTAFGHYHVHIFLVEEETNYLVLRASSGFPSAHMHRLSIGDRSLNSRAVQRNEAVMVNDVMHDPDFRGDEQLAEVRSELVVPLRIGDRIIGTLDVQGAEVDTFSPEDVLVIQSLGDQTAIAIENARHYRQARQAATMAERQRLARELHDSLIQSLYSLTLLTEGGRRLAASGRLESATGYFTDLWEIARQSLKEMRLLIYELRPIALESAGLVGAIQQRLDAVEGRAGVEARLLLDGELEFPPLVEEALYRIAQEALNNALKHAAATVLTVRLETRGGQISLQIQDNGRGFDLEEANQSGGLGLSSMRERAEQMGGELTIQTNPENGTVVQVTVEVPDE